MSDDIAMKLRLRTRINLWNYVVALDELIGRTGPENRPPRFAEAVAAREGWTDSEVRMVWDSLSKASREWLDPWELEWCLCLGRDVGEQVRREAESPLNLSRTILGDLRVRWRADSVARMKPEQYQISGGSCVISIPGGEGIPDRLEIPAPIMEPVEHERLAWCADRLLRLHNWLDWRDQATHKPADRPLPFRVVGGDDDADPKPALELGEAAVAEELYELNRTSQARLVEFMVGRDSATFTDAGDPIYGNPYAKRDRFRKTVERVNGFLELKGLKIRYSIASERIFKKDSVE